MATQYLDIEDVPEELQKKVHQDLAFKTGSFVWRVRFNTPLNPSTVNATNMYITDQSGILIQSNIRYEASDNTIEVSPRLPFQEGVFYYLNITTNVRSRGGQKLKKPIKLKFKL